MYLTWQAFYPFSGVNTRHHLALDWIALQPLKSDLWTRIDYDTYANYDRSSNAGCIVKEVSEQSMMLEIELLISKSFNGMLMSNHKTKLPITILN